MNNLKRLRKEAKLTLEELGDMCGKVKSRIWKLEQPDLMPNLTTAYAIAKVLGKTVYDIWPDTTEVEVEKVTIRRVKRV